MIAVQIANHSIDVDDTEMKANKTIDREYTWKKAF